MRGVEFLGDSVLAHLASVPDGAPLVLRLAAEERAMLGEGEVALAFPVARALLFDRGGKRIAARAMTGALV